MFQGGRPAPRDHFCADAVFHRCNETAMIFTINQCSIDTDAYEIRRNGELVPVEPQVFDLLVLLLQNRDRVVTKDEIIERVWKGRIVSEASLSSRIKALRQAIGDDGASQNCIRTIRRRGFRVVAEVGERAGPAAEARTTQPTAAVTIDIGSSADTPPGPADPRSADEPIAPVGTCDGAVQPPVAPPRRRPAVTIAVAVAATIVVGVAGGWYALDPGRHAASPLAAAALGMPAGPAIAVLPFNNLSGDLDLDFFRDALTNEIITELTRFSELRVAARALTSKYDSKEIDVLGAGKVLGVEYLVQGSLRRSEDRVRVTAQLMDVKDGTLLWGETYERHLTPVTLFAVQEDVA